ncbi:MAG: helix-turn-helix transcriptional regulator [Erysipelotrichaceae bacterium]|nr:helix-turn-helix transcriptional regulator [Erysipelotrichaceae bacterium]
MNQEEIIINEAIRQFAEKGLRFTVQDIAENLHMAKKTIYHSFSSKEELLIAMLKSGFARIQEDKRRILSSEETLPKKLRRAMIAIPDEYAFLDFRQLSGLEQKYPSAAAELHYQLEANWEPIYQVIEEGKRSGQIRKDVDLTVLRLIVTSAIENFISSEDLRNNNIEYQEALNSLMNIIMKGICL